MRDGIINFFTDQSIEPTDTLLFYYSGHGVPDVDGDVYFAASETDYNFPYKRGFSFKELAKMIQRTISTRVVVILDCCYSGSANISKGQEGDAARLGTVAIDNGSRILQGEGRCLLAASQALQEAYVLEEENHSLFTYYVLRGLQGKDQEVFDQHGNVTVDTLSKYLYDKIMTLPLDRRPKQKPLRKIESSGDIILVDSAHFPNLKKLSKSLPKSELKKEHKYQNVILHEQFVKKSSLTEVKERTANGNNPVERLIGLLNSYDSLYKEHSNGKCNNYLSYFANNFPDEMTFIQSIMFPAFLKEILDFTNLDYIPSKRNMANQAPDFTPIDTFTHPFIFETKGTDSSKEALAIEFENKSRFYLTQDANLQFAVITNMRDVAVYSEMTQMFVEEFSFSIQKLYGEWQHGLLARSKNTARLLAFIDKFKRQKLTHEQKLNRIIDSPQHVEHVEAPSKLFKQILNTKILSSVKHIVNSLKSDVASQGIDSIDKLLANDPSRKHFICNEINHILKEISSSPSQRGIEDFEHLKKVHANSAFVTAIHLYFYRVAYFAMTRLILIRAWEDARFIGPDEVTLYDGGLRLWYHRLNNNIEKVLDQSYRIGKEKYEWLFKDDTNYSWYRPTKQVLIDVLYELAQYDFSELDKDILGTIYEQYLDKQDRKKREHIIHL